jgi:hypothetical protein
MMATGMTPVKLLGLAVLACLVSAVLGAKPLAGWVESSILADSAVQQAADEWLSFTERFGLDRPYNVLRRAVREAEAAH